MSVTRVAYTAPGWGEGELWFEGTALVWHELPRPRQTSPDPAAPRRRRTHPHPGGARSRHPSRSTIPAERAQESNGTAPGAERLVHTLGRYFRGERVDFASVEVAFDEQTPFQQAVADALRAVPWGEVVSYRELAGAAGFPNAQRAAGTFCAHNRFPLVVPCHRVVASHGVGGYGSLGVEYKCRLLELEGVAF